MGRKVTYLLLLGHITTYCRSPRPIVNIKKMAKVGKMGRKVTY